MDIAEQFYRIFTGCERGHGEYQINSTKGLKATGKAKTLQGPATLENWMAHLVGRVGLGVVPITERNTCTWGAVDVDQYEGLDIEDWSIKLPHPLVLCRSKSGGAHIFLFTKAPVPAQLMRKKLALVARAVGHANAEIFPKQNELDENGVGNWINMPYFNGNDTTRYCIKAGVPLSMDDFVYHVEQSAITLQQLVSFEPQSIMEGDEDPEFADAPPCLRHLVKYGFPKGSMNNALFCMGVFAKKKFHSNWKEKVAEYNLRFMGPGSYQEVQAAIKSLDKKSYLYKCKDQPIAAFCDRIACADAAFGVQLDMDNNQERAARPNILDEVETPVICYTPPPDSDDEPYWIFRINGRELRVTADMIPNQGLFRKAYVAKCRRTFLPVKDKRWNDAMNDLLDGATEIMLSGDAGPEGQMLAHLSNFCTNKSAAKVKDEILLGKPWHDDGRTYFRLTDLMTYLEQQRYRGLSNKEIPRTLLTIGGTHIEFSLKGKSITCWSVPSYEVQNDEFDHEELPDDERY